LNDLLAFLTEVLIELVAGFVIDLIRSALSVRPEQPLAENRESETPGGALRVFVGDFESKERFRTTDFAPKFMSLNSIVIRIGLYPLQHHSCPAANTLCCRGLL
jgi:hypothetical protein